MANNTDLTNVEESLSLIVGLLESIYEELLKANSTLGAIDARVHSRIHAGCAHSTD
jgi:hypothetical protein